MWVWIFHCCTFLFGRGGIRVRTGTEAFVPLTMHRRIKQDHCIGWTRHLHVLKMNRITTRACTCNTHQQSTINKGTMSMHTRVQVPRPIDYNNTYVRIKESKLPMKAKISKSWCTLTHNRSFWKVINCQDFLLLLRFFATDEELVVDVDWSWSGATDKTPSGTPLGPPTSDTPGYGRYRWEIAHRANKTS